MEVAIAQGIETEGASMTETYFTITDEKGSINISDDVIAAITTNALSEMEGIAAFSNTAGGELSELIGKKPVTKGIHVSFEENAVSIDVTVMVRYGKSITDICKKAQDTGAVAVDSITGVKLQVNVRVAGISFDK